MSFQSHFMEGFYYERWDTYDDFLYEQDDYEYDTISDHDFENDYYDDNFLDFDYPSEYNDPEEFYDIQNPYEAIYEDILVLPFCESVKPITGYIRERHGRRQAVYPKRIGYENSRHLCRRAKWKRAKNITLHTHRSGR